MKFKILFESAINLDVALEDITNILNKHKIPYALIGGLCLGFYKYKRFTEDIDILITEDGYKKLIDLVIGKGYIHTFKDSRGIKNAEFKIPIDFIFSGEQYGIFVYPNPKDVSVTKNNISIVSLKSLLEIKIASGLANKHRPNDLADAQLLIKHNTNLPNKISDNKTVQEKYQELLDLEKS